MNKHYKLCNSKLIKVEDGCLIIKSFYSQSLRVYLVHKDWQRVLSVRMMGLVMNQLNNTGIMKLDLPMSTLNRQKYSSLVQLLGYKVYKNQQRGLSIAGKVIMYYQLVKYHKDDEMRLTKVGNIYCVIFEDSVTN